MKNNEVQNIAKQTMEYIKNIIVPGMYLGDIRKICEDKMFELGADSFWYYNIGAFVFADDETIVSVSGRKYKTSDRIIKNDDIITIDLSPQYKHIWGDYARTIIIENSKVVDDIEKIKNEEWRNGLKFEDELHKALLNFVNSDTTFENLYFYMNDFIEKNGFINLDFNGNLGHSINHHKFQRIYIEKGNKRKISSVKFFTFEPHIGTFDSLYGYKKENIYYFNDNCLAEL